MELKNLQLKRVTAIHDKGYKWPVEKKIEVVTKWMALGNLRLVAELTGVSYGLVRIWKTQDWWADLVAEINASRNIQTNNKLQKIVDKSLEAVEDRVSNGEFTYNRKTGDIVRTPVSALTAHKIANDLITQQNNLMQQRANETAAHRTEKIEDTLKLLAVEFAKFNTGRTINVQAKDVSDAIYEEREAGLREGTEVGSLPWTPEGSRGAEQSPSDHGEGGEGTQEGWDGCGPQDSYLEGWEDHEDESEGSDGPQQPFLPAQ